MLTGRKDPNYSMEYQKRGKCVIINNTYFDSPTLGERKGTLVDRESLARCFNRLDFDVQNWDEKEAWDIRASVDKLAREDFSDHDCLVICVLTHGEANYLYAKDDKYCIEYLFDSFKSDKCKTLAGKPKIFVIQACRGDKLDNGAIINFDVEDSNASDVRIPQWADFLMAYSTVPGFYSWRNTTNGSWFIQAFVTALAEHYQDLDLLSIFTITNQKVAYDFESNTPNLPDFHQRKQIPMIASMLTRKVYFNKPKPKKPVVESSRPSTSRVANSSALIASFNQLALSQQLEQRQQQMARQSELIRQAELQQWRQQHELQRQLQHQAELQQQKELAKQQEALLREQRQPKMTKEDFLRDQAILSEKMNSSGRLRGSEK